MLIIINGQEQTVDDGITIASLLAQTGQNPKYLAVECNKQLIPRKQHAECQLQPGDQLEIVTLVGGG